MGAVQGPGVGCARDHSSVWWSLRARPSLLKRLTYMLGLCARSVPAGSPVGAGGRGGEGGGASPAGGTGGLGGGLGGLGGEGGQGNGSHCQNHSLMLLQAKCWPAGDGLHLPQALSLQVP